MSGRTRTRALASLLLRYPDAELVGQLADLTAAASTLPRHQRELVGRFLDHLATTPLLQLQEDYVATFDLKRKCCLYLSYYLNGDTRRRGMALVGFKEVYHAAGLTVSDDELPDYLPMVLEFAACVDPKAGQYLLVAHRRGLEVLRAALHDLQSPYADLVDAVVTTLPTAGQQDLEEAAVLAAAGPPTEMVGLEPFHLPDAMGTGARS
jgi:nitrate reductase delta subunit